MKKLLMVLLMTILAMAATSSLATTDSTANVSAEKILSFSALGPGDFTEVAIPLAAPFGDLLQAGESGAYILGLECSWAPKNRECCGYRWYSGPCCTPQVSSCEGLPCRLTCMPIPSFV